MHIVSTFFVKIGFRHKDRSQSFRSIIKKLNTIPFRTSADIYNDFFRVFIFRVYLSLLNQLREGGNVRRGFCPPYISHAGT